MIDIFISKDMENILLCSYNILPSDYITLLYIAVVLCVVIGQLYADKCDYHAMVGMATFPIFSVSFAKQIYSLVTMFIFSAYNVQ